MSVTDQSEPNHVLEALLESPETHTELMLAVEGRVVTHHNCKSTLGLNIEKLFLKPLKLVARIAAFTPNIEVEHVARVSVVGNES